MRKIVFWFLFLWIPFAKAEPCYKETMNIEQLTECANQGDVRAQFKIGWMYEDGKDVSQDYKKAFEWYSKAAEQDFSNAQYALGKLYGEGLGVTKNEKKSFEWSFKAAVQGYPNAQYAIGWIYDHGYGDIAQDHKQAIDWYTKAANKNVALAKNDLGVMYAKGRGTSLNYVSAYMWFSLAILQNDEGGIAVRDDAVYNRNMVAKKMTPAEIEKAKQMTNDWLAKHPAKDNQ